MRMIKRKIKVNAVLDSDLEHLLQKTGEYERIIEGHVRCKNCDSVINIQNIGIIVPNLEDDKIPFIFYCERIDCTQKYQSDYGEL